MCRCCGGPGEGAWMPGSSSSTEGDIEPSTGRKHAHLPYLLWLMGWQLGVNGVNSLSKAIPLLPCRHLLSETHFLMGPIQMYSLVILHSHSAEDKPGLRRRDRQKESAEPSYQSLRTGGEPLQPAAAIGQWLALRTTPTSGLSTPNLKASRVLGTWALLLGIQALSVPHLSQS